MVAIPATSKIRHWTRPVKLGYGHPMAERKFLGEVYGLATPDDTRQFYDSWAESYDSEVSENGYATPARVAEALARHASSKEIELLDFGCGTGLSGLALLRAGFTNIDGADLSADMLKGAAEKQVYRRLWQVDAGSPVPSSYAAIAAIGVIGSGAAPAEVFDAIFESLRPGTLFAFSFNDHTLADPEYESRLHAKTANGSGRLLFQEYGPHLPGLDMKSNVYVIEKT